MKDYMLRMGRQLNGIEGTKNQETQNQPKLRQTFFNYNPQNYMRKELWTQNGLPLFFQALDMINAKQKKKTWHTYKRGRKRHGIYRKQAWVKKQPPNTYEPSIIPKFRFSEYRNEERNLSYNQDRQIFHI